MSSDGESLARFQPVDAGLFAALVHASGVFAREARFSVSPAGFSCVCFDPGNVAFLEWRMAKEYFRELPVVASSFDVSPEEFAAGGKGAKDKDDLVLRVTPAAVFVEVVSGSRRSRRRVPLLECNVPSMRPKEPQDAERCEVRVAASDFLAMVKEAAGVSECAELSTFHGVFNLTAEADLRSVELAVTPSSEGEWVKGVGAAKYGTEYLVNVATLAKEKALDKVLLVWTSNRPLNVVYEAGGLWVHYVVAPRVPND